MTPIIRSAEREVYLGVPKYVPHRTPYCIIVKVAWGSVRTMRVPEEWIPRLLRQGWSVVIRDSDMVRAAEEDDAA